MTVKKHLRSVSRAAFQRLGILRKSWLVFHDIPFPVRCFRYFLLPVFEYSSAVWCSAADTHLKLLYHEISGARFLTGGVFECEIAHRRSVALLCMVYKIRCNLMHPLNGALPEPYVPVRFTRGALVAHRYTYAPPRCRTQEDIGIETQYRAKTFALVIKSHLFEGIFVDAKGGNCACKKIFAIFFEAIADRWEVKPILRSDQEKELV